MASASGIQALVPPAFIGGPNNLEAWRSDVSARASDIDTENGSALCWILSDAQKVAANAAAAIAGTEPLYPVGAGGALSRPALVSISAAPTEPEFDPAAARDEEAQQALNNRLKLYEMQLKKHERSSARAQRQQIELRKFRAEIVESLSLISPEKRSRLFPASTPLASTSLMKIIEIIAEEYARTVGDQVAELRANLAKQPSSLLGVAEWALTQRADSAKLSLIATDYVESAKIKYDRILSAIASTPGTAEALSMYKATTPEAHRTADGLILSMKSYVDDNREAITTTFLGVLSSSSGFSAHGSASAALKSARDEDEDTELAIAMGAAGFKGKTPAKTYTQAEVDKMVADSLKKGDGGGKVGPITPMTTLTTRKDKDPCYFHTAKHNKVAQHSNEDCKSKKK